MELKITAVFALIAVSMIGNTDAVWEIFLKKIPLTKSCNGGACSFGSYISKFLTGKAYETVVDACQANVCPKFQYSNLKPYADWYVNGQSILNHYQLMQGKVQINQATDIAKYAGMKELFTAEENHGYKSFSTTPVGLEVLYLCCPNDQEDPEYDPFPGGFLKKMRYYSVLAYHKDTDEKALIDWNSKVAQDHLSGFEDRFDFTDEETNTRVFGGYDKELKSLVVVFRGTEPTSGKNWWTNFKFWQTKPDLLPESDGVEVHAGYCNAYTRVRKNLMEHLAPLVKEHGPNVICVGHSKGGAEASVHATDLGANGVKLLGKKIRVELVTFGAPSVGNKAYYNYQVSHGVYPTSVENTGDPVPKVLAYLPCVDYCPPPNQVKFKSKICRPFHSHTSYLGIETKEGHGKRHPALSNVDWQQLEEDILLTF